MPRTRDTGFRINAKAFILTYPRCTLDKQAVLRWVQREHDVLGCRVAREDHQDGTPHIHVVFHLSKNFDSRRPDCFDIEGFHPNIQATRCLPAAYDYLRKEGDYIDYGRIPAIEVDIQWSDIIDASSKEEALSLAKRKSPRDFVLNYDKLLSFCEQRFPAKGQEYEPKFHEFAPPPRELADWCDQRLNVGFSQFFELHLMRARSREPSISTV